jgi:hypothetical protein
VSRETRCKNVLAREPALDYEGDMIITPAMLLAASLLGHAAAPERAYEIARDVVDVAREDEPLFPCKKDGDCEAAREKTALLLTVWTIRESGGVANLWGDNHTSVGAMQFKPWYLQHAAMVDFGMTVDDVLASRKVSLRLGLAWMRYLKKDVCKTVKGALNAYASGSCIGSMESREKVKMRCALAGGC